MANLPAVALAGLVASGCMNTGPEAVETQLAFEGSPAAPTPASHQSGGPARGAELKSAYGSYLAGRLAHQEHDIRAAADFYLEALAAEPNNRPLLRRALFLLVADGRVDEAVPLAERLLAEGGPEGTIPTLVLALSDVRRGDYRGALALMDQGGRTGFSALLVPMVTAWSRAGLGQYEEALGALEPLASTNAFSPYRLFHSGLIQQLAGDEAAAEASYREAIEATDGGTVRIVEAYGGLLERQGRLAEARALFETFATRSAGNPVVAHALERLAAEGPRPPPMVPEPASGIAEALLDAGSALARDNARDAARSYIQLALYLRSDLGLAQTLLGELYESDRRWEEAQAVYRRIDRETPYGPNAKLRVAVVLDRLDRTEEALGILREEADRAPKRTEALITMADILRGRERYAESAAAYDRALTRIPEFDERHWSLFYARGIALERSKQWKQAEKDLLRALELRPDEPLVLNYLGYSWVEQGDNLEQALEMIEKAVELRPNDGYIVDSLGWVHYRLGNYGESVRYLERAIELRPEDPTINDHLGDAYWRVGRLSEARFQWQRALSFDPAETAVGAIEAKLRTGLAPEAGEEKGS